MSHGILIDTTLQGAAMARVKLSNAGSSPSIEKVVIHSEVKGSAATIGELYQKCVSDLDSEPGRKITRVVVGQGPGSFTGIKVGLSFVYGLQIANSDLLVKGDSTLSRLAEYYSRQSGDPVAILLPATRTHGFLSQCTKAGDQAVTGLFEIERDWDQLVASGVNDIRLCRSWAPIEERRHPGVVPLEIEKVISDGLVALAEGLGDSDNGFSREFPPATYHRLSTAEERRGQERP